MLYYKIEKENIIQKWSFQGKYNFTKKCPLHYNIAFRIVSNMSFTHLKMGCKDKL